MHMRFFHFSREVDFLHVPSFSLTRQSRVVHPHFIQRTIRSRSPCSHQKTPQTTVSLVLHRKARIHDNFNKAGRNYIYHLLKVKFLFAGRSEIHSHPRWNTRCSQREIKGGSARPRLPTKNPRTIEIWRKHNRLRRPEDGDQRLCHRSRSRRWPEAGQILNRGAGDRWTFECAAVYDGFRKSSPNSEATIADTDHRVSRALRDVLGSTPHPVLIPYKIFDHNSSPYFGHTYFRFKASNFYTPLD